MALLATPALMRQIFPEFIDVGIYPDQQIQFWLGVAENMLDPLRWYNMLEHGAYLFTAHHLTIAQRDKLAGVSGAALGSIQGAIASKTVDKVSVSYSNDIAMYQDAGFWNLTTYGLQYWNLVRMVGAGGIQL